jgi:hypothetical protein
LSRELGAGSAIRVRRAWAAPEEVDRVLQHLGVDIADVDLILDLEYLDSFTAELVEQVLATFAALRTLGRFRSMTLLSGSVPSKLEQTALWERPRIEEGLWRAVAAGGGREIRLGDYGVVHPGAGTPFPSKHVNVKYTCPEQWLFVREPMSEQLGRGPTLRIVCRDLVESGSFSGSEFSWGDAEIARAANGGGSSLGSTSKPVAIGMSHHFAYLASLHAA